MDEQNKQTKKMGKYTKAYLNIYSVFLFFSSLFYVGDFLGDINFPSKLLSSFVVYGFFSVHIFSFIFFTIHGKETLKKEKD